MCHEDITKLFLALWGAVASGDPTSKLFFSPLLALNLKLDGGIIVMKDARVFFPLPLSYVGCVPTATWLWHDCAMLLKGLFKLSNTLSCRRNPAAGMPRRADAAHLAPPSSSAVPTCCIGPNTHLHRAASGEPACNWNSSGAQLTADCSVPATHDRPAICFQLSLVSLPQQWQKTRDTVMFGNQFSYKDIYEFQSTIRVAICSTPS